jgi:hypothetical protein
MKVAVITGSGAGLSDVNTAAGEVAHHSFTAIPDAQGELVLRFSDEGGDSFWTVNALEIRPTDPDASNPAGFPTADDAPKVEEVGVGITLGSGDSYADGSTIDTVTVTVTADATPRPVGTANPVYLYTLSTTAGEIMAADADPNYAGIQVAIEVADSSTGMFTFDVKRPRTMANAVISVDEVNGASRGNLLQFSRESAASLRFPAFATVRL